MEWESPPGPQRPAPKGGSDDLEPIFVNHDVDVVFQGHNHYFSRSYPILNGVVDVAGGSAGRLVRELVGLGFGAGVHSVRWDGRDGGGRPVASGVYFARLIARDRIASARLVLIR